MTDAQVSLDAALSAVSRLRATLGRGSNRQVRNAPERELAKAVATAWFRSQRLSLSGYDPNQLAPIDTVFREMLRYCEANTTRTRYLDDLNTAKNLIAELKAHLLSGMLLETPAVDTQLPAPDFAPLVAEPRMRDILARRWNETQACLDAGAHLAATVMMGGLLEALLLARMNKMPDKRPLFKATVAPQDSATGKTAQLKDWTLKDFIAVGHELGWLGKSALDVSVVLRDWRNYI